MDIPMVEIERKKITFLFLLKTRNWRKILEIVQINELMLKI
jgi:hypothetical protein